MAYAANPIDGLMDDKGEVATNDAALRAELEFFVPTLRNLEQNRYVTLSAVLLERYRHDLHGLFKHLSVGEELYWITMRINKLSASTELSSHHSELIIPDPTVYTRIVSTILSNRREKK